MQTEKWVFQLEAKMANMYRGTSLVINNPSVGPHSSICLGTYGDPRGLGVSGVPLYTFICVKAWPISRSRTRTA